MMIVMLLMAMATLSSCDEDVDQAYDLNGIWQGTIQGNYYSDRYHTRYTDWDTEIQFVQEGEFSRGGYGTEKDYQGNYLYNQCDFTWTVRNGRVYMKYTDGYRIVIDRYDMYTQGSGYRFKGYFKNWDTNEEIAAFNLVKVANWSNYSAARPGYFGQKKLVEDSVPVRWDTVRDSILIPQGDANRK